MPQKELDNMGSTNDRKFIFGFITFTCSVLLFYHFNPQITKEMYVKTARARKTFELREFKKPLQNCKITGAITTIFDINPAVKNFVNNVDGSCLVVVGDKKSPHYLWKNFEQMNKNVIYLSPDEQLKLPYNIVDILPWNHFGRKSIAFMVAIDYGAEVIYDFDDDNHLMLDMLENIKIRVGHIFFNYLQMRQITTSVPHAAFYILYKYFMSKFYYD